MDEPAPSTLTLAAARRQVEAACATAGDGDELLDTVSQALHRAIPHEAALWFGADPKTLLARAPGGLEGLQQRHCWSFWEREFLVDDVNLFRDLAQARRP